MPLNIWLMIFASLTIKCSTNPYSHIYKDIQSGVAPTTNPSYSMITEQESYNPMIMPTNVRGPLKHIDKNGSLRLALVMSLKQSVSLDEKN